ncbi:MAG: tyrosine-type recombinase/integrase [Lachnospiraceae bacterium]|nr:tyrosine-type recombinase/integrase [Lachnospiraceae bacterium]
MESNRVYYKELQCWQTATQKQRQTDYKRDYFDLKRLPTDAMKQKMRTFLLERGKSVSFTTILNDRGAYRKILQFLSSQKKNEITSFQDEDRETWIRKLKGWMMLNGIATTYEKKSAYGTVSIINARLVQYFNGILDAVMVEDEVDELEKDIWRLERLDIEIRANPIYNVETINFQGISQSDIKEEFKKVVYLHLKQEALGTVQREMTTARQFSKFLKEKYPQIQSCEDMNRAVLEEYLVHKMTQNEAYKSNADDVRKLRSLLETAGKIYNWPHLEKLFLDTDIPPEIEPEFKVYTDEEMKRLNAQIVKLDEQIARCLIIHQMLGTRISDTLTLKRNCLYLIDQQDMVTIDQVKTDSYQKPISRELAQLIQKAILYTAEKYGETEYIFVNDKNPERPLQYGTIKSKVMSMIGKEKLLDDHGKPFRFGTHLFRHYYGVKLTEMHLDDWTLTRLLGHKRLKSVKNYRKMSNQQMADETRKVREMMSEIILANLEGWGQEYEQIR